MTRKRHIPSYRFHKASGQAIVSLPPNHSTRYLGPYESPESHREYDCVIAGWLANDRSGNAIEPDVELRISIDFTKAAAKRRLTRAGI